MSHRQQDGKLEVTASSIKSSEESWYFSRLRSPVRTSEGANLEHLPL